MSRLATRRIASLNATQMKAPSPATIRRLEQLARKAARRAYAPYSEFRVGAAVLGGSGKIFAGCNVENASYGLCNCAERTAIFSAVAAGEQAITAIAVYSPTAAPTMPCGACRQVVNEFGADAVVISVCDSPRRLETTIAALLPEAFGPANLGSTRRRDAHRR